MDLVKIAGMRCAYRIAVLVRDVRSEPAFDASRRSFLIKLASVAAVVPLAPLLGELPPAKSSTVGPLTAAEAAEAYTLLRASSTN